MRASTDSVVYLEMAELICVTQDSDKGYSLEHKYFDSWWMRLFHDQGQEALTDAKWSDVVLALCFMAAMVEADDA